MKVLFWKFVLAFFILVYVILLDACSSSSTVTHEKSKTLPSSDVALTPSSFRCSAKILSVDSNRVLLFISEILQHGSSLFYSVSGGDTLHAEFISKNEKSPALNTSVEAVIEERLKLNSDKPDFVIRQYRVNH